MVKLHFAPHLTILGSAANFQNGRGIPIFSSPVQAGFPAPAEDDVESQLDLHRYCVTNPTATFFLRACGDSMIGAGIHNGDLLVVDRSAEAAHGRIVIAAIEGELTVKRLCRKDGRVLLRPENPAYSDIDITEREYVFIWGIVTFVIHSL
ncbi:MAG: translesion error-prone DNA polymerase V autoproteolytic subunit [Desulfovibrio sp.]|nr:translesion error-prone DNA polymerase V autoproteolytic subunit [Desulfovibrio sp.]